MFYFDTSSKNDYRLPESTLTKLWTKAIDWHIFQNLYWYLIFNINVIYYIFDYWYDTNIFLLFYLIFVLFCWTRDLVILNSHFFPGCTRDCKINVYNATQREIGLFDILRCTEDDADTLCCYVWPSGYCKLPNIRRFRYKSLG